MDDILTIHTSDGATLTVKRVHLLANSTVFADMMASASGSSFDLVETEEQLEAFLDALGGELGAFEKLDEAGLENFARLADKYDSVTAREFVRRKIWTFDSKKQHSVCAFVLSTIVDDFELVKYTALKAYALCSPPAPTRISSEWAQRMTSWKEQLRQHALRRYFCTGPRPFENVSCSTNCQNTAVNAWHAVGEEIAFSGQFNLAIPFTAAEKRTYSKRGDYFCTAHRDRFRQALKGVEDQYLSSLPEIPQA